MNQKTALYIAIGISTFFLVAIGSVALAWPALQGASTAETQPVIQEIPNLPADAVTTTQTTVSGDAQTLMATIEARDAAYQAQIEQANQQLNEAYQQLQELKAQNQLLQEREQIYQQRLQESAQIIEAMSATQAAQALPAYTGGESYEAEREDDDHYEKNVSDKYDDHDKEEDDD